MNITCESCNSEELNTIELQDGNNKVIAHMFTCNECGAIFTKPIEE